MLADLDHAWAEVFVDEPMIPRIKLGQAATVFTDAGGPGLPGKVSYIASKAEFTPRNVQTAEDRSKLVYRVKIAVDNSKGILKQGMPVEAEIPLAIDGLTCTHWSSTRVTKKYGEVVALRDLSMSVEAGEMFGLIGPDGAGKTTAIRLMCGLLKPDGGTRARAGPRSGEGAPRR